MNTDLILRSIQLLIVVVWTIAWKGWALWRAAKNDQKQWFVAILVVNTVGLLEIAYLVFFQKKGRYWEIIKERFFK